MSIFIDASGLVWHDGGPETDDHLAKGGHEPHLLQIAASLLPAGGTFVDVGAHVGLYTLNLARKAGMVYAIEANPETYRVLRTNVWINRKVLSGHIRTFNCAAWDQREPLALVTEDEKFTGGSTRCEPDGDAVFGMPLDDLLPRSRKIDLVKIDVEGAEARVLRGMAQRLADDRPVLLIEMHDMYFGESVRLDTLAILEALGYGWSDDLRWGGSYYVLAAMPGVLDEFVGDVVRAGL
jgi:FkbM family methyltransferase